MSALVIAVTLGLMGTVILLLFLLLKFTDLKTAFFQLMGWKQLDEEKAILESPKIESKASLEESQTHSRLVSAYQEINTTADSMAGKATTTLPESGAGINKLSDQSPTTASSLRPIEMLIQDSLAKNGNVPKIPLYGEGVESEKSATSSPFMSARSEFDSPYREPLKFAHRRSDGGRSSISSDDSSFDSDEQSTPKIRHAYSTESIESNCSALELTSDSSDLGQLEVRLYYDRNAQMFHIWVLQAYDVRVAGSSEGEFWVVMFLLPHPKPLWRTQLQAGPHNPKFHEEFKQCVRPRDLSKIALMCQMYVRTADSGEARLVGQIRVRLKDVSLVQPNTLWLNLLPVTTETEEGDMGEVSVSLSYLPTAERLTIVLSKIRNLRPVQDGDRVPEKLQVRAYLVNGAKVSKKKTSAQAVVDGAVQFNESMIFNLPQKAFNKVHVRLSISELLPNGESGTLGHVTLGAKTSGKTLGHWQKLVENPRKPVSMWHSIKPKKG